MLLAYHEFANRFLPVFLVFCLIGLPRIAADAMEDAKGVGQLLAESGLTGGVIVHLGCNDGSRTVALKAGNRFLIHGLDDEPDDVAAAREHIQSLGLYGSMSVDRWDGRHLPYVDNAVNGIVADESCDLSLKELVRVLCPRGVAYVRQGAGVLGTEISRISSEQSGDSTSVSVKKKAGGWIEIKKSWPENIDQWTHFLHDAGNNAVAHDDAVGPPRRMQWLGSPRYSRHHDKMSSISAVVSATGRVFYIMDEAPHVSILMAPQWNLIARDAFNGTILWRRQIDRWHSHLHGLKSGPADLPRRLVAVDDRVYVTLGIDAPLSALDAATGETVHTYQDTENTEEILCSDGVLFLQVDHQLSETQLEDSSQRRRARSPEGQPRTLMAIDSASGQVQWSVKTAVLKGTLAADSQHVVFFSVDKVVCLDRSSGKEQWHSDPVPRAKEYPLRFTPTLVLYEDVVLFAGGEFAANGNRSWAIDKNDTLTAISAETGKILWNAPHPLSGYASAEDLLVAGGVVWSGETTSGHAVGRFTGRDVHTGQVLAEFDPDVETYWFHHRCYRGKATDKYLLMSRTGTEFIDIEDHSWSINHWVRGACLYGIMPANGLLYAPQNPCACYLGAKLNGFAALAAAREAETEEVEEGKGRGVEESGKGEDGLRLEKGPAYESITDLGSENSSDWPTYRCDAARSGGTTDSVPAELRQSWATEIGGRLSSPVVAGGRVFLASIDAHTVHAVDAANGRQLWQFTAGSRVDSPPTYWQGRLLFGSTDGCVYCLRAADGVLAWRFRAAPLDQRLMSFEQLESVWPVHGSVLIHDGVLFCIAGRSMFLDGGIRLVRLDPKTGRVLSEIVLDDRDVSQGEGRNLQDYARQHNMPAAMPDILSCDGRLVYMRGQPFDLNGNRLPLEALPYGGNPEQYSVPADQRPEHAHVFSPTGFLDDTWWHRSYWIYGSLFLGGWAGYPQAGKVTPAGRILVFDESDVYGFGRKPKYYRWTTPIEHHLFCAPKDPTAIQRDAPAGQTGLRRPAAGVRHRWTQDLPFFARALILADGTLFAAGPPDLIDEEQAVKQMSDPQVQQRIAEQEEAYRGDRGGMLWAVSADTGHKLSGIALDTIPVFDGMAAAGGCLYLSGVDGRVICLGGK